MKRKPKPQGENVEVEAEERDEEQFRSGEDAPDTPEKTLLNGDEDISGDEAPGTGNNGRAEAALPGRNSPRHRKVLLFGSVLLCLFLAGAGFFVIMFESHFTLSASGMQRLEPVTCIRRPIPQPDYREMLDFLLVYEVEGREMITAIRMEVEFESPARYQNFKERKVVFRDKIYKFLLMQNAAGNSVKSWHTVLEKNLLDYLKLKLPQSYPDTIILTQVENL